MKIYKLSNFGLNKQILKRKLKKLNNSIIKEKVKNILNKRTTKYNLDTIEFIIDVFYFNKILIKKSEKEKVEKLKILIDINKNGYKISLEKEIRKIVNKYKNIYIDFNKYNEIIKKIADRFCVLPIEIDKIINKLETEWLNKIIK